MISNEIQAQLFEGWVMLSTGIIAIQWSSFNRTKHTIHWIETYLVRNVIHLLNNLGLVIFTR